MKIASLVLKILMVALFAFSSIGKILMNADVVAGFSHFGFDSALARPLGILELTSAVLFLIPGGVSFIGAVLLTGYLGGAIVTHLRIGEAPILQTVLPILVWVAFALGRPEVVKAVFSKSPKTQ